MSGKPSDQYDQLSADEIARRLDRALKKSVTMSPKPHKSKKIRPASAKPADARKRAPSA